jgi:hypothetical protein
VDSPSYGRCQDGVEINESRIVGMLKEGEEPGHAGEQIRKHGISSENATLKIAILDDVFLEAF